MWSVVCLHTYLGTRISWMSGKCIFLHMFCIFQSVSTCTSCFLCSAYYSHLYVLQFFVFQFTRLHRSNYLLCVCSWFVCMSSFIIQLPKSCCHLSIFTFVSNFALCYLPIATMYMWRNNTPITPYTHPHFSFTHPYTYTPHTSSYTPIPQSHTHNPLPTYLHTCTLNRRFARVQINTHTHPLSFFLSLAQEVAYSKNLLGIIMVINLLYTYLNQTAAFLTHITFIGEWLWHRYLLVTLEISGSNPISFKIWVENFPINCIEKYKEKVGSCGVAVMAGDWWERSYEFESQPSTLTKLDGYLHWFFVKLFCYYLERQNSNEKETWNEGISDVRLNKTIMILS